MKNKSLKTIEDYLKHHEYQIAFGEDDFGDLKAVFMDVIGRKAELPPSGPLVYRYGQHPDNA